MSTFTRILPGQHRPDGLRQVSCSRQPAFLTATSPGSTDVPSRDSPRSRCTRPSPATGRPTWPSFSAGSSSETSPSRPAKWRKSHFLESRNPKSAEHLVKPSERRASRRILSLPVPSMVAILPRCLSLFPQLDNETCLYPK